MKEEIFTAFKELGFTLTPTGETWQMFEYEGVAFVVRQDDDDDESFFCMAVPQIADFENYSLPVICALNECVNSTIKYVKANVISESVWLFYERELIEDEINFEEVISHMVQRLMASYIFAVKKINELKELLDSGESEEDDNPFDGVLIDEIEFSDDVATDDDDDTSDDVSIDDDETDNNKKL